MEAHAIVLQDVFNQNFVIDVVRRKEHAEEVIELYEFIDKVENIKGIQRYWIYPFDVDLSFDWR